MAGIGDVAFDHMMRPFTWGESDCCLAVCDVLAALGWPDPAASYRGAYADEIGARAFGSAEDIAARECARLGWPEVDPATAMPGDVGVYGNSLMIRSEAAWIGKAESGLVTKQHVRRAWRPR